MDLGMAKGLWMDSARKYEPVEEVRSLHPGEPPPSFCLFVYLRIWIRSSLTPVERRRLHRTRSVNGYPARSKPLVTWLPAHPVKRHELVPYCTLGAFRV